MALPCSRARAQATASAGGAGPSKPRRQKLWLNHYHYTAWPDFGVPTDSGPIRTLSHALDGCRRAGAHIVVHCSAGIGRTGTFCTIDILLQRLDRLRHQLPSSYPPADGGAGATPADAPAAAPAAGQAAAAAAAGVGGGGAAGLRATLKDLLNVPAVVHGLRKQRMGMVQTGEQYTLCYAAVVDELLQLRAAAEEQLQLLAHEARVRGPPPSAPA
jgi:tyrosine-protein phosphatase non-receptor type 9